jgi:hypothetical protein
MMTEEIKDYDESKEDHYQHYGSLLSTTTILAWIILNYYYQYLFSSSGKKE